MGPCVTCGKTWEDTPEEPTIQALKDRYSRGRCPSCWDAECDSEEQMEREAAEARYQEAWKTVCPPLYLDTDPNDPRLSQKARQSLEAWNYAKGNGLGLGIFGSTGKGKTRLVFWRLQQIYLAQRIMPKAISSVALERAIHRSFHDDDAVQREAEQTLAECYQRSILFIDDVGKEKFTERVSSHFYALIEHRTAHLLPTLWTTNMTGHELKARLGGDKGEPTLRRLKEFSTIVEV